MQRHKGFVHRRTSMIKDAWCKGQGTGPMQGKQSVDLPEA